jgi:hypothetical protein
MKRLALALAVVLTISVMAQDASAHIFGRRAVVVNAPGTNVVVQRNGLFGRRVNVAVNNGFNNVAVVNRGFFGRRTNVFVNNGFVPAANVAVVNGRGFNTFVGVGRVNVFGTRTFTDFNGNVFEADAFGNTVFRGNAFNRGFGINGFSAVSRSFFAVPQSQVFVNSGGCFGGRATLSECGASAAAKHGLSDPR